MSEEQKVKELDIEEDITLPVLVMVGLLPDGRTAIQTPGAETPADAIDHLAIGIEAMAGYIKQIRKDNFQSRKPSKVAKVNKSGKILRP